MKTRLIAAAALLAASFGIQAMPTKPAKCPSADSIRTVGLGQDLIAQDDKGKWIVGLVKSNYDTTNSWTFIVGEIDAQDGDEALTKATASLSSLKLQQGPIAIEQISRWGCLYNNDAQYVSIAITPDLEGGMLKAAIHSIR